MSRAWFIIMWYQYCFYVNIAAKTDLRLPVFNLTVPYSNYNSLIRSQTLTQWQQRWTSKTENKPHAIEPRLNFINLFCLPREMRFLFTV